MVGRTKWLNDPESWPLDILTAATKELNAEVKATKQPFALAVEQEDELDNLLAKLTYWRTLQVCAWIMRFIRNARTSKPDRVVNVFRPLLSHPHLLGCYHWRERSTRASLK